MTESQGYIPGGYILLARQVLESGIMTKPPLYFKLWVWMILQASHQEHKTLKRGQFSTSIDKMRVAMTYKIGYRTEKPSKKEIRGIYEFLTKGHMIVTAKVTSGMLITILNYDYYQTPSSYERHREGHHESQDRGTPYTIKVQELQELQKKSNYSPTSSEVRLSQFLLSKILEHHPNFKKPDIQKWAKVMDLTIRIDKRTPQDLEETIEWLFDGNLQSEAQFVVQSPNALREKFDRIQAVRGQAMSEAEKYARSHGLN